MMLEVCGESLAIQSIQVYDWRQAYVSEKLSKVETSPGETCKGFFLHSVATATCSNKDGDKEQNSSSFLRWTVTALNHHLVPQRRFDVVLVSLSRVGFLVSPHPRVHMRSAVIPKCDEAHSWPGYCLMWSGCEANVSHVSECAVSEGTLKLITVRQQLKKMMLTEKKLF